MKTRDAMALVAALACTAVPPGFAASPLGADDRLTPDKLEWVIVEPGKNPLSAKEASAVLAFLFVCINRGRIEQQDIRYDLFGIDARAGGADPARFVEGGDLFPVYAAFSRQFSDRHPGQSYWAVACNMNPYIEH